MVQLTKFDRFLAERRRWAAFYDNSFAALSWLRTPMAPEGYEHGWQSYVCYVDESAAPMSRNEIMAALYERGISTRPGTHAVHMTGYYRNLLGLQDGDLPVTRDCNRCAMALPLHNRMTAEDCQYIADALKAL